MKIKCNKLNDDASDKCPEEGVVDDDLNGIVCSNAIKTHDVDKQENKKFNDVDKNEMISSVSPTTPQDVSVDPLQPLIAPTEGVARAENNENNDDQVGISYFEESEGEPNLADEI